MKFAGTKYKCELRGILETTLGGRVPAGKQEYGKKMNYFYTRETFNRSGQIVHTSTECLELQQPHCVCVREAISQKSCFLLDIAKLQISNSPLD